MQYIYVIVITDIKIKMKNNTKLTYKTTKLYNCPENEY